MTRMEQPPTPSPSHCEKVVLGSSTAVKRRICEDVKYPHKRRRLTQKTLSQKLVLSSDDSSEDVFSEASSPHPLNRVVPHSQLDRIRRRLYPETSTQIVSSNVRRSFKKKKAANSKANRRSRVLSSEDSSEEHPPTKRRSFHSLPSSQRNKKPQCLETLSQSVLISSSEDSDFELHNSRKSQNSFLSQSLSNTITPRSATSCFSSQMYKDRVKRKVSLDVPKTRRENGAAFDSAIANGTSRPNEDTKPLNQKTSFRPRKALMKLTDKERYTSDISIGDDLDEKSFYSKASEAVNVHTQSADVSSIYLQNTIPPYSPQEHSDNPTKYEDPMDRPPVQTQSADVSTIYLQRTILSYSPQEHSDSPTKYEDPRDRPLAQTPSIYLQTTVPPSPRESCVPTTYDHNPIYDESTVDPAMQWNLDSLEHSREIIPESTDCSLIGPSDEDDELCRRHIARTAKDSRQGDRPSFSISRAVPLDISHISCSDNEEAHSENDSSVIETSAEGLASHDAFLTKMASLLLDARLEPSGVITPIMNSLLGSSPDFFSDIASSVGTGGSSDERQTRFKPVKPEKTTPVVSSLALERSVLQYSNGGLPECDESAVPGSFLDSSDGPSNAAESWQSPRRSPESIFPITISTSLQSGSDNSATAKNCNTLDSMPECGVPTTQLAASPSMRSPSPINLSQDQECSNQDGSYNHQSARVSQVGDGLEVCGSNLVPARSGSEDSAAESDHPENVRLQTKDQERSNRDQLDDLRSPQISQVGNELDESSSSTIVATVGSGPCECSVQEDLESAVVMCDVPITPSTPTSLCSPAKSNQPLDQECSLYNGADEIRITCSLPQSISFRIIQNVDKSLLNTSDLLLLDVVIFECQQFAEAALNREPLHSFILQYSKLPIDSKIALHSCLLDLLQTSDVWVKIDASPDNVDRLVTAGIIIHTNHDEGLVSKLNALSYSEAVDILKKLGNHPEASLETTKNILLDKLSSLGSNDLVKKEITEWINKRFVKLKDGALFCIRLCLELFVVPLSICDKLINYGEIARYVSTLIRDVGLKRICLLPLKTSQMPFDARAWSDLNDLCQLRVEALETATDVNILNRLCASLAILDALTESDPVTQTPTSRQLFINTVHALDERMKQWLSTGGVDVDWSACVHLGFLLKQTATGFPSKIKWCRERMKVLVKLVDPSNFFENFASALEQPISEVDFFVRSEFIAGAMNVKKLGLSLKEKSKLAAMLRPSVHTKAQIALAQSTNNFYKVITKKGRRNVNFTRASIFEHYKSDFPSGFEDNGGLLLNTVYLVFWEAIYLRVEGVFLSRFQQCPVDWGSREFFLRREAFIRKRVVDLTSSGLPAVEKVIDDSFQFAGSWSVVDWNCVVGHDAPLRALVRTLGLVRFVAVALHVLGHVDERVLGVPEMVLWNEETKRVKFLGLKKPGNSLYPYQVLWLEKLTQWGIEAEECQFVGAGSPSQSKSE